MRFGATGGETARSALPRGYPAVEGMFNSRGVIEVDEDQVGAHVVAAGVNNGGRAEAVEKGSGKFGAFVDVAVQRQEGLVFFNPAPHRLAADVPAIEKHIAARAIRRGVNDRHRVRRVCHRKPPEFLGKAG